MPFLSSILGWLASGGINAIGSQINHWREISLKAANDSERIEADKQIAYLEGRRDILLAEQGSWVTRWIRPAFALPFVLYDSKVIIYDKLLGLGATDDLSPNFWYLHIAIVSAYFLTRPFEKRKS